MRETKIDSSETSSQGTARTASNLVAWLFGCIYATCIGPALPSGSQVLLVSVLLFPSLWILAWRPGEPKLRLNLIAGAGVINGVAFALISNYRVLALNSLVGIFLLSLMLLKLYRAKGWPESLREYAFSLMEYFLSALAACRLKTWKEWISEQYANRSLSISAPRPSWFFRVSVAVILFFVFHQLLAEVNQEYEAFAAAIWDGIFRFIRWLWEVEIFVIFLQAVLMSFSLWALLKVKQIESQNPVQIRSFLRFESLAPALITVTVLLAVFSCFQGKLLFINPAAFSYKELALYVQKGFWQLLVVAGLGFVLWQLSSELRSADQASHRRERRLLAIFAAELLLLSFFSQHKLLVEQFSFGFRDQRVLASCGVLLISLTFAMLMGQAFGRIRAESTFRAQYWCLIIIVFALSFSNLDLLITRFNPIRFVYEHAVYKDYAYLLTNSYDNSSTWLGLMDEAEQAGMPVPEDYYWGVYAPLYSRYRSGGCLNMIRRQRAKLFNAYAEPRGIRQILRFNLSEYRAYRVYHDNQARIEAFAQFVDTKCE